MIDRYLFRGKREKDEQWEYGAFWQSNSSIIDKSGYSQKVIPETVGQCTGLKDKNGKLIFEGDILKSRYDNFSPENVTLEVVVWYENSWFKKQRNSVDLMDEKEMLPYSEVCGNVHDNSELLEVKK